MLFNEAMQKRFGGKVYRLALSCSNTCPNRDGHAGTGGCIFCSGSGSGEFASSSLLSVDEQIEEAKKLVAGKLSHNFAGYIAYFQSYTGTYGDYSTLKKCFSDAIKRDDILAISVATRPDCLQSDIIDMLSTLKRESGKPVWVELGLQTVHDKTAELINRCYKTEVYDDAVSRLQDAGLEVITHIMIGLPGEDETMIKETVRHVAGQHVDGVKLHMLYVLKGTKLDTMISEGKLSIREYTMDEYVSLVKELAQMLPSDTVIHRVTGHPPRRLLVSPKWATDKKRLINALYN